MTPLAKHIYVQIRNVLVHCVQYGPKESIIKLSDVRQSRPDKTQNLVVFVPGNPGYWGVYHSFLGDLYQKVTESDPDATILVICHNNFDHPDHVKHPVDERIVLSELDILEAESKILDVYKNEPNHTEMNVFIKEIILKRLLEYKLDAYKLCFVAHSIGAYCCMRLIEDPQIAVAHAGSVYLHPAVENLATTPKGLKTLTYVQPFMLEYLLLPLAYVIDNFLPRNLKLQLYGTYFPKGYMDEASTIVQESVLQFMTPQSMRALVEMARSEFTCVKDAKLALLQSNASKISFIYAKDDYWVNSSFVSKLKESVQGLNLIELPNPHAFTNDKKVVDDYVERTANFIRSTM